MLNAVAVAGAMALLGVALALVLDLRVVLFGSGSMSPTFNTGDAALVRTVPVDQVRVGDVVTTHREGLALPVTHRVMTLTPDLDLPGSAVLELKGDANVAWDPVTYHVTEVAKVMAPLPGVGPLLSLARRPWVMPTATVLVAVTVAVAWWPRGPQGTP